MPKEINGTTFYDTAETCRIAGISRPTLFRWLKRGILDTTYRDRKGWRLFTEADLNKIKSEAQKVHVEYSGTEQREELA